MVATVGYATRKRITGGSRRCCVVCANALGNSQGQVKPLNSLCIGPRGESPSTLVCASDSSWCKSVLVVPLFPPSFSLPCSRCLFPSVYSRIISACVLLSFPSRPFSLDLPPCSRPFFRLLSSLPRNYSPYLSVRTCCHEAFWLLLGEQDVASNEKSTIFGRRLQVDS